MCLIPKHNVTMVNVHVVILYELLNIGFCVAITFYFIDNDALYHMNFLCIRWLN